MIKSIKAILAQDKEKFKVPRKVQDLIPIKNIWPDGIFKVGNKFSKSFRFSDINYLVASREDKESMFLTYSELLNSLDSGATTKITINNHRLNRSDFEESILMPMKQDGLDEYRKEYNDMLLDKATGANGITQAKYITITVAKKDIEEARAYFARIGADLTAHFANLGSKCVPLNAVERLRITMVKSTHSAHILLSGTAIFIMLSAIRINTRALEVTELTESQNSRRFWMSLLCRSLWALI